MTEATRDERAAERKAERESSREEKRQIVIQPAVKPPKPPAPRTTGRYSKLSEQDAHIALGLRAAGWPMKKINAAMQRDHYKVMESIAKIPDAQGKIDGIRERVRLAKMQRSHDVDTKLWDRLEKDVPTADAKDVDALFRSAYANKKIQQSLVGAAIKVEVKSEQPHVELNQLLVQLGVDGLKELQG